MTERRSGSIENWRERIPEHLFVFTFARSGGPGGQHVNKVATRVTLWFDIHRCAGLDERARSQLQHKLAGRINADGLLRVSSRKHRTQAANRRACVTRFYELIAEALTPVRPRRRTRPPAGADRRRLDGKRRRSTTKKLRRYHPGDTD